MAIESPGQVSSDSRSPLERLRRCQLWLVADKAGIQYPNGAKKSVMVSLLEANGIDPRQHIKHAVVYGRDETGMPTQEEYPVSPDHASLRKGVDSNAVLNAKIEAKAQAEEKKFEESRMDALERQNRELMEKLNQVLADKPAEPKTPEEFPFKLTLAQKKQLLKQRGIDTKGMTREDVDAAWEE